MGRILLVDGESNGRGILASHLLQDEHQIWETGGVEEARRMLAGDNLDVVITGQSMPDGDGLTILGAAHGNDPTLSVIFLNEDAGIEMVVKSMRQGAFDVLTKPFPLAVVSATVRRACEHTRLLRENILLKDAVARLGGAHTNHIAIPLDDSFDLTGVLEKAEKEMIVRTLNSTRGAQAEAARRMGLSRSALAYKLHKYGIRPAE